MLWKLLIGAVAGIVLLWLVLVVVLWLNRRSEVRAGDLLRLLPDTVRLVSRLARDPSVPRGVRIRLWLVLAYLLSPIDLIPDFIPVIGYADDAIVVALVLRSVVHRAGVDAVKRHWPGNADGLATVVRLAGLDSTS